MNFMTSGFTGLGASLTKKAPSLSADSAKAIFGSSRPAPKPLFSFGFTDKLLFTLAVTMIGIAAVRKAIH